MAAKTPIGCPCGAPSATLSVVVLTSNAGASFTSVTVMVTGISSSVSMSAVPSTAKLSRTDTVTS